MHVKADKHDQPAFNTLISFCRGISCGRHMINSNRHYRPCTILPGQRACMQATDRPRMRLFPPVPGYIRKFKNSSHVIYFFSQKFANGANKVLSWFGINVMASFQNITQNMVCNLS